MTAVNTGPGKYILKNDAKGKATAHAAAIPYYKKSVSYMQISNNGILTGLPCPEPLPIYLLSQNVSVCCQLK